MFTVDVGPDGTIISGSGDGSLRFWRTDAPHVSAPDAESLKQLVADSLPYVDYGNGRFARENPIKLCDFTGNCPDEGK